MKITEAQLDSFIALYKTELNISLSRVEAQQKALSLLRFFAFTYNLNGGNYDDILTLPGISKTYT